MEKIEYRQIHLEDVLSFRHMHAKSWLDTYITDDERLNAYVREKAATRITPEQLAISVERIKSIAESKNDYMHVALKDAEVIGFIHGRKYGYKQGLEAIYVSKEYLGTEVAKILLQGLEEWFDDTLPTETTVTAFNKRAIAFYEKNGFKKDPNSDSIFEDIMPVFDLVRSPKITLPTVLIVHGIGGHAGIHWQQWLHDELKKINFRVIMPNLSDPDRPDRQTWINELRKALYGTDLSNLIIVGHSLGVPAAMDVIEELNQPTKALVSVSGFYRPLGAELNDYYMKERQIDIEVVRNLASEKAVFYGDDDPYVPQAQLLAVAEGLKVDPIIISKGGHINTDTGFVELPQALEYIQNIEVKL